MPSHSKGKAKTKRTPIQEAKDKLRATLTARFKLQLKEKLAARDAVWRLRLQTSKLSAAAKRDAASARRRATKERKSVRYWARKEEGFAVGHRHHYWR